MAARDCAVIGRWRIVQSVLWRVDDLDLLGPARVAFDGSEHGGTTIGARTTSLRLEYTRTTVFFRWHGSDDMTEVTGEGSAEHRNDRAVEVELIYHDGDEAILKAARDPTSSAA